MLVKIRKKKQIYRIILCDTFSTSYVASPTDTVPAHKESKYYLQTKFYNMFSLGLKSSKFYIESDGNIYEDYIQIPNEIVHTHNRYTFIKENLVYQIS